MLGAGGFDACGGSRVFLAHAPEAGGLVAAPWQSRNSRITVDRKHINRCGKWLRSLLGVAAGIALAGCGSQTSGQSEPAKPDPAKPGVSQGQIMEVPVGSFMAAWKVSIPLAQEQVTRVSLNEDKVFVLTSDGKLYWIDRVSGVTRAVSEVAEKGDKVFDPVTLKSRIVVPTEKRLVVFETNGKLSHSVNLRYNASSGAVGEGTALFLGVDHPKQGRIQAVDTKVQPYDISPIWELSTGGQTRSRPAVFQGAVFAGSRDGAVYGVRGENRDVLWPILDNSVFQTGAPIVADLAADKDGVFVASTDTKLYCLNAATGKVRWTYYAGIPLKEDSAPVSVGSFVYIYVPGKGLVAIDKTGQAELRLAKWTIEDGRQVLAIDEKNTYVRMADNSIAGVERATGQIRMRSSRKDFIAFASNVNFKELGTIYAATSSGTVMAIKPVTKPGAVGEWVLAPAEPHPVAGR
jgi:outer membrane protein assembly factor BamB